MTVPELADTLSVAEITRLIEAGRTVACARDFVVPPNEPDVFSG